MLYQRSALPSRTSHAASCRPVPVPAVAHRASTAVRAASTAEAAVETAPVPTPAPAPQTPTPAPTASAPASAPPPSDRQQQDRRSQRRGPPSDRRAPRDRDAAPRGNSERVTDPNVFFVTTYTRPASVSTFIQNYFSARPGAKATDQLRLVCRGADSVPAALRAVAEVNAMFAGAQAPYRLKVMSSVRRKAGESPYTALNREDVVALLFVTKVPASEVPAADTENKNEAKVGRNSVWYKVAVFTGARFDEGAKSVRVAAAGPRNIVTAYKALMLARYNTLRATRIGAPEDSSVEAVPANNTPRSNPQPYTVDLTFVPTVHLTPIVVRADAPNAGETVEMAILTLNTFKCDPPAINANPELRLQTPRPSRTASPTRDADDGVETRRPRRPRAPRADAPAAASGDTVTVSTKEWQDVNAKLETMATQQAQLLELLDKATAAAASQAPPAAAQ